MEIFAFLEEANRASLRFEQFIAKFSKLPILPLLDQFAMLSGQVSVDVEQFLGLSARIESRLSPQKCQKRV